MRFLTTRKMNNFSGLHLFYTPGIQSHHEAFILSEEESKHAIRVLRLTAGEHIRLVDGRGGSFRAAIADAHPKRTVLTILEATTAYQKRPYRLHVAIAPTKRIERLEWFLEKATEVGIDEVTPVICDRSERKEVKPDRLRKVAVAAMKQSQNASGASAVKMRRKVSSLGVPLGNLSHLRSQSPRSWAKRSKSVKSSIPLTIAARAMKSTSPK